MDFFKKFRREEAEAFAGIEHVRKLTARDAMITPVFLSPDDDSEAIIKKLKREDINVCIVVDKDRKFLGEIADRDLISLFFYQVKKEPVTQILNVGYRREFMYKKAVELMKKHKSTAKVDTPLNHVIELLDKEGGFSYIPVLDKEKKVIGVVTPSSVISLLGSR